MQNLYETVKKVQMVVQVEAVKVQKEIAVYVTMVHVLHIFIGCLFLAFIIFCAWMYYVFEYSSPFFRAYKFDVYSEGELIKVDLLYHRTVDDSTKMCTKRALWWKLCMFHFFSFHLFLKNLESKCSIYSLFKNTNYCYISCIL